MYMDVFDPDKLLSAAAYSAQSFHLSHVGPEQTGSRGAENGGPPLGAEAAAHADFATGDQGGDIISLVAYLERIRQHEAAHLLARMLGIHYDPATVSRAIRRVAHNDRQGREIQARSEKAITIWQSAEPAEGTLVENYLASRGLHLAPPMTLRFLMLDTGATENLEQFASHFSTG